MTLLPRNTSDIQRGGGGYISANLPGSRGRWQATNLLTMYVCQVCHLMHVRMFSEPIFCKNVELCVCGKSRI